MMKTILLLVVFFCVQNAFAAELYDDKALLLEAHVASKTVGLAPKGEVTVLDRKGFWVNIQSGKLQGWTQLSTLKMEEEIQWMRPMDVLHDTGRLKPSEK
ncbi:MAG: hypothetical protein R8K49_01545 [Mariprofundaceae bacterium]